ncbi:hypothetical protein [Streptomyces mangrovisoli]|uniref:Secreted protein n=1 Tax=Streptomyces mangrovisoli TaxID=1428628 RepID=A0A1J4NZ83_9ACTN|nr:hypothetical protein [Streptomyces mangrovisoli]OIJ67640.1 hypothetical protein WN71_011970 [Streptomyces mangrovisoli]
MRRTTSPHPVATVLALAAAALLLAGCDDGKDTGSATAGPSATSSAPSPSVTAPSPSAPAQSPSAPAPSPSATASGGCVQELQLTAADNGRTVCLARGGQVRLTLDGTAARPWDRITASGSALTPANPGVAAPRGDAVAAYRAVAAGSSALTSSRPLCPEATSPGQVSCKGIVEWAVTVDVR